MHSIDKITVAYIGIVQIFFCSVNNDFALIDFPCVIYSVNV